MLSKLLMPLIGLSVTFFGTVSPLLAASGFEEEPFDRPFNVLWLAVFLMAIAVFLSLAHWRSEEA